MSKSNSSESSTEPEKTFRFRMVMKEYGVVTVRASSVEDAREQADFGSWKHFTIHANEWEILDEVSE